MRLFRHSLLAGFLVLQLVLPTNSLWAAGVEVRPFLIDEEMLPRQSITHEITLQNNYPTRKAVLYATVNEINLDSGGQIEKFVTPVMTDRTSTPTSWIEINRGRIEVPAGEKVDVPLTIRVNPHAKPGEYHIFIGLVEAAKRNVAEAVALAGEAKGVILKLVVVDERKDSLRISRFLIDRFVTNQDSKHISVEVENTGDLPTAPTGEIIFYDSRGAEVNSVAVQADKLIGPGETATIDAIVPMDSTLGRFKANVSLSYGDNQKASLYDTTYFFMLPWNILILILGLIIVVSLLITLLLRRSLGVHYDDEDGESVTLFVKDGHEPQPKDHDIDLKKNSS